MSQVPELIDALVARWRTDEGLAGVKVTDGPLVTESAAREWVTVGYDGDEGGLFQAGTTEQDWAGMGTSRTEATRLSVGITVRRGDNEVKAARDRAYAILAVLAASLRADPTAGVPSAQVAIAATDLRQEPTGHGARVRLVVTLACRTFA